MLSYGKPGSTAGLLLCTIFTFYDIIFYYLYFILRPQSGEIKHVFFETVSSKRKERFAKWFIGLESCSAVPEALLGAQCMLTLGTLNFALFISGRMIMMRVHATHTEEISVLTVLKLYITEISELLIWDS